MLLKSFERRMDQARLRARDVVRTRLLDWYCQESGDYPLYAIEDERNGGRELLFYMDPPIPGIINPMLVEMEEGGSFVLKIEPRQERIIGFVK